MSLETDTGTAGSETPDIAVHKAGGEGPMSVLDAARSLADWRNKKAAATPEPQANAESAPEATAEPVKKSAPEQSEADAAPPQEATGETQEAEQDDSPPIEPPRSWTKEAKDRWQSLPRETQEYLAEREQDRDRAVRQSQNEAAELKKGLTAKEQAVEQARQQYESALPIMLNELQGMMAGEFADIRSMADVQKLANEDWPRYVRWDAQQKQVAAVQQQITIASERQNQERAQKLNEFKARETEALHDKVPELRDEKKRVALTASIITTLKDTYGFTDNDLGELSSGARELPLYDHRLLMMAIDAHKYREAQKAQKQVTAKPLPQVQKPGVTQGRNAGRDQEIQNLSKQLDKATGINALRIATELRLARQKAAG